MGTLLAATGALVDGPVPWWPTTDRVTTAEEARHFVREVHRSGLDFVKVHSSLSREAISRLQTRPTEGLPRGPTSG
jgi:thiamine biosynthesis protein ThiC